MTDVRQAIIQRFLKQAMVLDTESTGLDPKTAEICEVGVCFTTDGKKPTKKDMLIGTEYPIPFAASSKNNISRKMLEGLPTFKDKAEEIAKMLRGTSKRPEYFVAHNFKYDKTILESSFSRTDHYQHEEAIRNTKWICTYRIAKHLFQPSEEDANLSYSLNYLRYAFDLPVESIAIHRAGDDAEMCWQLLVFICEYVLENMETVEEDFDIGEYLFELSKSPVPYTVMPFGKHKGEKLTEVPDSYYNWMLKNSDILNETNDNFDPDFAASVEQELNRRMGN